MPHLLAGEAGVYPIIKTAKNCGILPFYYSMLRSKQHKLHFTGRSKIKFQYRKNIFKGSPSLNVPSHQITGLKVVWLDRP
jgi:hypothetical protein